MDPKPKLSTLIDSTFIDLVLGVALASILVLGAECPIADSITAGLMLIIVLALMDIREGQVQ